MKFSAVAVLSLCLLLRRYVAPKDLLVARHDASAPVTDSEITKQSFINTLEGFNKSAKALTEKSYDFMRKSRETLDDILKNAQDLDDIVHMNISYNPEQGQLASKKFKNQLV